MSQKYNRKDQMLQLFNNKADEIKNGHNLFIKQNAEKIEKINKTVELLTT